MKTRAFLLFLVGWMSFGLPATAQPTCEEATEQDVMMYFSLYAEDFRNAMFEQALPNLRWIIRCNPFYPNNTDRNFARLITTFDTLANRAPTRELRRAYRDSVLWAQDLMINTLERNGMPFNQVANLIWRGRYIQTHQPDFSDLLPTVTNMYREAFRIGGSEVDTYSVQYVASVIESRGNRMETVAFIDSVEAAFPQSPEMIEYVAATRNRLFPSGADRLAFLKTQLERRPQDSDLILEIFELARTERDENTMRELAPQILNLEPSVRTLRAVATVFMNDGRQDDALRLLEQAASLSSSDNERLELLYNMGAILSEMGRSTQARAYFRRALEINADHGLSLMGIGALYAQAGSSCRPFDYTAKTIFWLAVDYFERARRDNSVADLAGRQAAQYRQYFPTREEMFFRNVDPGSRVSINTGCYGWVGETTTAR